MNADPGQSPFPSTRWTLVLRARDASDAAGAEAALARLCGDYWYPLYSFARRQGQSTHDAEDLTQGFFVYLLQRQLFAAADPDLGRLRTFLLTAFRRYMRDDWQMERAQKRGGGREIFSFDSGVAEERYRREPATLTTPEHFYEKRWAHATLEAALRRTEKEEVDRDRGDLFRILEPFLLIGDSSEPSYEQAALDLKMNAAAVRQAVKRLRKTFRQALRLQVAETLRNPTSAQLEEELAALQSALRA